MKKEDKEFQRGYEQVKDCKAVCSSCGYSATMMANTEFKICTNCGHKMKNNSKARFKYMMMKLRGE